MWSCKHCKKEFAFERTTEKANHTRHCDMNPKKIESYRLLREKTNQRMTVQFGDYKNFSMQCSCCNETFFVKERSKLFPQKKKYFCSRNCANSEGGKAKSEKYGWTQYSTIAEKHYKKECAVCGVTDILDVHHIDEDRSNNHPSNLIFLCPNDHYRLHRNDDISVKNVIEGHGTAWGGHFVCTEEISGVQIPMLHQNIF